MAPFKFAKKNSKEKPRQEPVTAPKPPIPPPNPKRFMQGEKLAISSVPEPLTTRVFPTPVPAQQRNVSSASALQQTEYTPWSRFKLANSPFPRYRHVASAYSSEQQQLFVIGGLHDQSVYGDTWIISAHENGTKFTSKTVEISDATPPPRVGHASSLCGNAFVIFGGDTHKVNSEGLMDDDVYLFNVNSYKWTIPRPVGPRPLGRYGHKISVIATSQLKTKLFVFGGQFDDTYFNDLAVFDLSSFRRPDSHWQFVKPNTFNPPPLTNHTMISYDFKLWVFGGDTPQGLINDLFMFDPQLNDWRIVQTSGEKPSPLQEHAAILYGDLMCVIGGKDEQDVYSNSVYFLNLISLKWFKFPFFRSGVPQGRSGHSLTLLPNNKLLIMGGDKFDYARSGEDDYHTSEVDLGCGTLLYSLDLSRLKEQCPGIFDVNRIGTPQKFSDRNPASPHQTSRNAPGQQQNILTPFSERYQTPKTEQGDFPGADRYNTPKTDSVFTPRTANDDHSEVTTLPTPQDIKKPMSPVPQLKTSQLSAQSPPPRVVSLRSTTESDYSGSKGHDSQLSGETSDEYGVAMIGNSPGRPVVRESIIPENETLEHLPSHDAPEDSTPQREESFMATLTPESTKSIPLAEKAIPLQDTGRNVTKKMIDALREELGELRTEAEKSAQSASQRIKELESENSKFKNIDSSASRLVKLQTDYDLAVADKKAHEDRVGEVEDLLSKKFLDVARLHDVIKVQSSKIGLLDSEESYKEKFEELNGKYEQLLKEHQALKAQDREEARILHSSIEEYNVQLGQFLAHKEGEKASGGDRSTSSHHQKIIEDLRGRVDQMTTEKEANEASKTDISRSYEMLQEKNRQLENAIGKLEHNYENSLNSVNNASRALALSQEDLNKFKQENKRLVDELEELKYRSADRRDVSLTSNDDSILSSGGAAGSEPKNDMRDAPYRLKIKDLKAELFIIKQERNSLKDDVLELKKKLLNLENDDD